MKKIFGEKHRNYRGWGGFVAALVFAAYTWGGFLWAPEMLRTQIQATALEVLQREVSIGAIRFNPFTLTAHLLDVKLVGHDGEPVLSVPKLKAHLSLASLWRRGTVVSKMVLAEPRLQAVIAADGTVNLSELIGSGAKTRPAERPALPRLWIGSLTFTKATIDVIDRRGGRNAKLRLTPLDLSLEDFRTEAGHATTYRLALPTARTEQLTASGKLTLRPLEITGSLTARALSAGTIHQLLGRMLPVRLATGSFDFVGSYTLALEPQLHGVLEIPQIVARNVAVNERNSESSAPLQAPRVELKGLQLEWPERRFRLDTLAMTQARLYVVREAGGAINLTRGFQRTAGASSGSVAAPWRFVIKTIDLQQASIAVDDELATSTAHFDFSPTHITINDLSNAADATTSVRIATQLDRVGQITVTGELGVTPWLASLELEAAELPLVALQPYVDEIANLTLTEGKLGFTGQLTSSSPGKLPTVASAKEVAKEVARDWRFNGRARLDGLRAKQEGREWLAWQSVAADGIDWRTQRLRIERIVAQQPAARVTVDTQGRLNLTHVWRSKVSTRAPVAERNVDPLLQLALEAAGEAGAVPVTAAATTRLPVQIGRIDVVDGTANVTDASIAPAFSAALTGVTGSVTGVSSDPGARAKLRLDARVDARAPLAVVGELNLRAPARFTDLTVTCTELPVRLLDPYAAKFAGYHLAKGKLTMQATYRVADGKVSAHHHVVLQEFGLGAATVAPKADALPAAVAVSLLKSRDGSITLDLPVSGRLDQAEFQLPAAPWQAFAQVVNDATATPFKSLGSAAGDGEELAYVDFALGSAEIPASEQAKIDRLASALKERPEVRLEIPFAVATQDDSVAVAATQLAARVPQATQDVSALDDRAKKQLIRLLEQQHLKDVGRAAPEAETVAGKMDLAARITQLTKLLLDAYTPSPTQLSGLGRARAEAVESALVATTGLESGRVVVVGDRRPRVTDGRVRLALGLSATVLP